MIKIKSSTGYLGQRFICSKCKNEVEPIDKYCKWCGKKLKRK